MEYPHGHHNRHHQEEDYPPPSTVHHTQHHQPNYPPPPSAFGAEPQPPYPFQPPPHQPQYSPYQEPPPPLFGHHTAPGPPPPAYNRFDSEPPPPVQHVSHHSAYEPDRPSEVRHETHHRPHVPSFVHHQGHHGGASALFNQPTVRVYSKADENFSLTIRDGHVILARSDPSDERQHWIKDLKYSTKVKDEEGFPSFALVNKATGQAIKHSVGATQPVQLIHYNPDVPDESVLWTESRDLGDTFRTIRMVTNIKLNLDAFNGDKNHGGVHDGTTTVVWEWKKGDNQRWKIAPF